MTHFVIQILKLFFGIEDLEVQWDVSNHQWIPGGTVPSQRTTTMGEGSSLPSLIGSSFFFFFLFFFLQVLMIMVGVVE